MANLTVHAEGVEQNYVLENPAVTVGRGLESDIRVKDIKASRRHCQIVQSPQGYQCLDLSSGNGTWVNGVQIKQQILAEGDKIQVGSTTITFHDGSASAAPPPAPAPAKVGGEELPSPSAQTMKMEAKPAAALLPSPAVEEAPPPAPKGAKAAAEPPAKPVLGAKPRRGLGARGGGRAVGAAKSRPESATPPKPAKKISPLVLAIIAVAVLAIAAGAYFLFTKGAAKGGGSGKGKVESPAGPGKPAETKPAEEKPAEPKK